MVLRRIFGPERERETEEVTQDWRRLHKEKRRNFLDNQTEEDNAGGACITDGR
jgi:hypothetical protein